MPLTGHLTALEAGGLIHLAQLQPEIEYLFRHALVQETAYDTLVKADRRRLHQAIGETLEGLYPARLASADLAPMLARHFEEAGDLGRALRYYSLAGQAAAAVYANAEAIQHFGHALAMAQALPASDEIILDLYLRRGRALELNAQDREAIENYKALEAWAEAHGSRHALLAALAARATIHVKPSVEQNLPLGYDLSQRALALAQELGDGAAEAKALWNLLQYHMASGQMAEAIEAGERALRLARKLNLREQAAYVLTDFHTAYFLAGQPAQAQAALEEAQSLWRELGVLNMLADNLASTALVHVLTGNYDQALAQSAEALEVSRAIGNLWNQSYSLYAIDLVHFDRGDVGRAIEVATECRRLALQAGFAEGINQSTFDLALIYGMMGALDRAFAEVQANKSLTEGLTGLGNVWATLEALIILLHLWAGQLAEAQAALAQAHFPEDETEMRQWFPMAHMFVVLVRAGLALELGRPERAIGLADFMIPYLREAGVRQFLPDVLLMHGRGLRAGGRPADAQAALEAARAETEAMGSRRVLWQILAELAELAAERGDLETAANLRRQAAEIIEYIAAHAGADELREAFLGLAEVRRVLEGK